MSLLLLFGGAGVGAANPTTTATNHWQSVREGDFVLVNLPYAGLAGVQTAVRVLARTYSEGDGTLGVSVQELEQPDPVTAAAWQPVVTPLPPAPPGATWPRLLRALQTRIDNLERE